MYYYYHICLCTIIVNVYIYILRELNLISRRAYCCYQCNVLLDYFQSTQEQQQYYYYYYYLRSNLYPREVRIACRRSLTRSVSHFRTYPISWQQYKTIILLVELEASYRITWRVRKTPITMIYRTYHFSFSSSTTTTSSFVSEKLPFNKDTSEPVLLYILFTI